MNKNKLVTKINELLKSDNYIYEIEDIDDMLYVFEDEISKGDMINLLHLINEHNMNIYIDNLNLNKQYNEEISTNIVSMTPNSNEETILPKKEQFIQNNDIDIISEKVWKKIKNFREIKKLDKFLPQKDNPKFKLIINCLILKYIEEEKIVLEMIKLINFNINNSEYVELIKELECIRQIRNYLIAYRDKDITETKISEKLEKNNLIFLQQISDNYCMDSDLKDFTIENYSTLLGLLESIEDGTFKNGKSLSANPRLKGAYEVKEGQVRVQYANIKDNNYMILSAFVKKCDKNIGVSNLLTDRNNMFLNRINFVSELLDNNPSFLEEQNNYYEKLKERLQNTKVKKLEG